MSARGTLGRLTDLVRDSLRTRASRRPASRDGQQAERRPSPSPQRGDNAGTDGIAVSYAPERDGDADPGEVVWAWVAYEDDPSQGKDRPVLVLGRDGPLLAVVPLSSKNHSERSDAGEWLPVGTGAWDREGRPSYADAGRLLRVKPNEVRREGAALAEARFEEVVARVATLHDWRR